jgi:site-specific recombinase XerD
MKTLQDGVEEYISIRRALGFKLDRPSRLLFDFVSFMQEEGTSHITTELALRWAKKPKNSQPSWWSQRLSCVRGFARYWSVIDTCTEIPPPDLLPSQYKRRLPYIYTNREINKLLGAAKDLPLKSGIRRWTYYILFGLLVVTGLRISEAIALKCDDVDLKESKLTIRESKFKKSRLIPIHKSTCNKLKLYGYKRKHFYKKNSAPYFFISDSGSPLTCNIVQWTFVKISHQIGLRGPSDSFGPRIHDMRHRFAVTTLLNWYRSGLNVERHIPTLSTYLGHVNVCDTYWYLSAVPELLAIAGNRFEKRWEALI